jgi:hypothetical protein
VHEAVIVRVATFRTTRPGFDAALRAVVMPAIHQRPGAIRVFAGRQGPEEIGARVLVSLWGSSATGRDVSQVDGIDEGVTGPLAETIERDIRVLPILLANLADAPLAAGILRLATGRLADIDVITFAETLSGHLDALRTGGVGPADVIMADAGEDSFVMLSTWPDWAAIEAGTGASVSTPLGTKRFAKLSAFDVDHFELLTDLAPAVD